MPDPVDNKPTDALRQGACEQAHGENPHAKAIDSLSAHKVADLSENEHRTRANQDVGDGHPHDCAQFGMEGFSQDGERDVGDACINRCHHGTHGDGDQGLPFVCFVLIWHVFWQLFDTHGIAQNDKLKFFD